MKYQYYCNFWMLNIWNVKWPTHFDAVLGISSDGPWRATVIAWKILIKRNGAFIQKCCTCLGGGHPANHSCMVGNQVVTTQHKNCTKCVKFPGSIWSSFPGMHISQLGPTKLIVWLSSTTSWRVGSVGFFIFNIKTFNTVNEYTFLRNSSECCVFD